MEIANAIQQFFLSRQHEARPSYARVAEGAGRYIRSCRLARTGALNRAHSFISNHRRLLRSLDWQDPDYGGCIYEFLQYVSQNISPAIDQIAEFPKVRVHLERNAPGVLASLGRSDKYVAAPAAFAPSATEVVRRALSDAESLLNTNGATSAIDRLHTVLHGYLRSACGSLALNTAPDASITSLFKTLRTSHPVLQDMGHQDGELARILTAFATVIDALNMIRNRGSVAHPNEYLVYGAEASLTVNTVRTLFNYLTQKIG